MNKDREKLSENSILVFSISGIIIASFILCIIYFDTVSAFCDKTLGALSPFVWGAFFALIISPIAHYIEKLVTKVIKGKFARILSSGLAVLLVIGIIISFIAYLAPQLLSSISQIGVIVNNFIDKSNTWMDQSGIYEMLPEDLANKVYEYSKDVIKGLWAFVQSVLPNVLSLTVATFSSFSRFLIGFVVCLYILIDRDVLSVSFKRFFMAVLDEHAYERTLYIYRLTVDKFYKFFAGKVLDSIIVGILCAVLMSLFKIEFVGLISFIIGLTNIIPFFGPFIGAIPSALILLMVNPLNAAIFLFLVLVLQQIDGNLIGPFILGDSVGLSSLWIMFAIMLGSSLFGFTGLLVGVPVFAVISILTNEYVGKKLKEKGYE